MKRIFLLPLFFLCTDQIYSLDTNSFFRSLELSSAEGLCIPVDEDNCFIRDTSTFRHSNGIKINLKNLTGQFTVGMDSTDLKSLSETSIDDFMSMQKHSWGIGGNLNTGFGRFDLYAGKVKFSQGISRLKTPWFSCPSPLKRPSLLSPGISPALHSGISEKPSAFAAVVTPAGLLHFLPVIQVGFLDNNEKYFSFYKRTKLPFVSQAVFSTTVGFFEHNKDNTKSWFQKSKYYKRDDYLSSETTLSFYWAHLTTSTAIGLYENPFGGIENWIRTQSFILIKNFTLGIYAYKSDAGLITASGTAAKTMEQLFVSPKFKFPMSVGTIETGIAAGISRKNTGDRLPLPYDVYSGKFSTSFSSRKISIRTDSEVECSTEDFIPEYSFQTQFSIPIGKHSSKSTFYYSCQNETKKTFRIEETLLLRKQILESIQMKLTSTQTEKDKKLDFESIAKFSRSTRKFNWSIKLDVIFRKKS